MKKEPVLWAYHEINVGDYILVFTSLSHHKERRWLLVTEKDPKPEAIITNDFSGRGDVVHGDGHVGWYASQIVYPGTKQDAEAGVGLEP